MQGHISKSSYTRKQRKEFLRTWTAIGRAHVSASHGPDLFQLLDIASSSLVADYDCGDCGPLYIAHPSPAGSLLELSRPPTASAEEHLRIAATDQQITDRRISVVGPGQTLPVPAAGSPLCVPNSMVTISMSNPEATSTSFGSSGLRRKKQADSGQASGVRPCLFCGFNSTAPAPPPPPTGNMLFGPKSASGAAPAPPPTGDKLFRPKPNSDAAPTHNTSSTSGADRVSKSSQCLIPPEVKSRSNLMRGTLAALAAQAWRNSPAIIRVFVEVARKGELLLKLGDRKFTS